MSSSHSGNSVLVSNSTSSANCITVSSSNSANSVSVSNSLANSITVSSNHSSDSGNSIVVNDDSEHSYGNSILSTSTSTDISNTLPQKVSPKSICQPQKKYKQEGDNDVTVVTSANETWLQAGSHKLTLYDKMTLMNENELSDHHINFAQYLLLNQFPSIN